MLIYDHTTNRIRNQTDPNDNLGAIQGTIHHLKPENNAHEGVILALTAVEAPLQITNLDVDKLKDAREVGGHYLPLSTKDDG